MACRICGNADGNRRFTAREMMQGTRDEFGYTECARCGCLQIDDPVRDLARYYPGGYYSYRATGRRNPLKRRVALSRDRYLLTGQGWIGRLAARRYPATILAVGSAMVLAFYTGDGKGAMALWPIFGGVNQLLAGLALLAVTSYLIHTNRPVWITLPPLVFMVIMTTWAMVSNGLTLLAKGNILLALLSGGILLLQGWMLFESVPILYTKRTAKVDQSATLSPETESF